MPSQRQSRWGVVFIHGFLGDEDKTWGDFEKLIKSDGKIKHFRVFKFSYPTHAFSHAGKDSSIKTLAEALLSYVDNDCVEVSDLILVCHSMGGLVARQAIVSRLNNAGVPLKTRGLMLYAVPNNGSELANLAAKFPKISQLVHELKRGSDFIVGLNEAWRERGLYDRLDVKCVIGESDEVVDYESAKGCWSTLPALISGKDHTSIVKPTTARDMSFKVARKHFISAVDKQNGYRSISSFATNRRIIEPGVMDLSRYRVVAFDFDNTIVRFKGKNIYSWRVIFNRLGISTKLQDESQKKYTRSDRSFDDYCGWCRRDQEWLVSRGVDRDMLRAMVDECVVPVKGLYSLLYQLRRKKVILAVISGGVDEFIRSAIPKEYSLFDYVISNELVFGMDDMVLKVTPTPYDYAGKSVALDAICRKHGLKCSRDAVYVGEGVNDCDVMRSAALGVAFNPISQELEEIADHVVRGKDITAILPYVMPDNNAIKE